MLKKVRDWASLSYTVAGETYQTKREATEAASSWYSNALRVWEINGFEGTQPVPPLVISEDFVSAVREITKATHAQISQEEQFQLRRDRAEEVKRNEELRDAEARRQWFRGTAGSHPLEGDRDPRERPTVYYRFRRRIPQSNKKWARFCDRYFEKHPLPYPTERLA